MGESIYRFEYNDLYLDHSIYITPGQDLLYRHTHSQYELLYILGGNITHVVEDRKYKLRKHDLVLVRPNQYHFVQIDSPETYERYNLLFDPVLLGIDIVNRLPQNMDIINCRHRPMLTELFRKMDYYRQVLDEADLHDITALLIRELLYNLTLPNETDSRAPTQNLHPLASKALAVINDNLFGIKSIEQIAQMLFVTESYLYRIFKQELKTTPLKYITEKRLIAAQGLLRQGVGPTTAYEECGFSDYSTFYRSYRKLFGHAPSEEITINTDG